MFNDKMYDKTEFYSLEIDWDPPNQVLAPPSIELSGTSFATLKFKSGLWSPDINKYAPIM